MIMYLIYYLQIMYYKNDKFNCVQVKKDKMYINFKCYFIYGRRLEFIKMFMFYIVNKIIEFVYNYLINCFIWKYMLSYYFLKK